MSRRHNIYLDRAVIFWTSSIVDWLPVLRSPKAAALLLGIWDTYRQRYGVRILGYVIMPEHVHLLVWAEKAETAELFFEQSLGRFSVEIAGMTQKAAAARSETAACWMTVFKERARGRSKVRVWKERGQAFPCTSEGEFLQKLAYIHNNPVRRGLASSPEEYKLSSAAWYSVRSGTLAIDELEP